jgi:hypothetical protein
VGPIAQSVEQRTFNPWVDGSSPSGPTHLAHEMPTGDVLAIAIRDRLSRAAKGG